LGINLGFIPGYLLERYPLHPTKPLHRPNVRGSAGIPDSLAHKPVDTSGRTERSGSVIIRVGSRDPFPYIPCFLVFFLSCHLLPVGVTVAIHLDCHLHLRCSAFGRAPDLRNPGNGDGGGYDRTDRFYSPATAAERSGGKSLEIERCFYCVCRAAELSLNHHRGAGKSNELHARRELFLPAMGLSPRTRRPH